LKILDKQELISRLIFGPWFAFVTMSENQKLILFLSLYGRDKVQMRHYIEHKNKDFFNLFNYNFCFFSIFSAFVQPPREYSKGLFFID